MLLFWLLLLLLFLLLIPLLWIVLSTHLAELIAVLGEAPRVAKRLMNHKSRIVDLVLVVVLVDRHVVLEPQADISGTMSHIDSVFLILLIGFFLSFLLLDKVNL